MNRTTTIGNLWNHNRYLLKKPRVIPRIISGFFRTIVLRKKVLRTIDWAVSYRCNAKCVMCSARKLHDPKRKEMTLEDRRNVWEQAKKLGVIHTQFTGGEPMCMGIDWMEKAIKDLEPENFLVCMSTNAQLIDDEKLERLRKAGMDTIQISLDSTDAKTHDQLRGLKNNYNHIMHVFRKAKELGFVVGLGCVISKGNVDEVKKLAEFTKKEGVMLCLNIASSPDNWQGIGKRYYESFGKDMIDYRIYQQILDIPHARNDTFMNFTGKSGCPAGERIYISAYGDVFTCPHVQVSHGNVLEEPLKDIWERICRTKPYDEPSDVCRWAFNEEFYNEFVRPFENRQKRPVRIEEVLAKRKKKQARKAGK